MKQSRQVAGGNPPNFLTLAHLSTPHSPKHLLNFLPATRYTSKLRLLCFHLLQHSGKLAFPKYIASRTLHLNRKLFWANLHKDILNILFGALHVPDASPLRTCTFSMIRGSSISPSSLVMHFVVVPPIAVQTHEMHIILLFPRANKIVKDVQRSTLNDATRAKPNQYTFKKSHASYYPCKR